MRTFAILCTIFIWSLAAGTLINNSRPGDARTALDVEISRENIAATGSSRRP